MGESENAATVGVPARLTRRSWHALQGGGITETHAEALALNKKQHRSLSPRVRSSPR